MSWVSFDIPQSCRVFSGFNVALLRNGRFWDGFTSATSACSQLGTMQSRLSIDSLRWQRQCILVSTL